MNKIQKAATRWKLHSEALAADRLAESPYFEKRKDSEGGWQWDVRRMRADSTILSDAFVAIGSETRNVS